MAIHSVFFFLFWTIVHQIKLPGDCEFHVVLELSFSIAIITTNCPIPFTSIAAAGKSENKILSYVAKEGFKKYTNQ